MSGKLLDPNYSPEQWLVLLLKEGQAYFVGYANKAEAEQAVKDNCGDSNGPILAALYEYMVPAFFGNSRAETLAEAMRTKAQHRKEKNLETSVQPVTEPKNLHPALSEVWWQGPRDSDFPDFPLGK